VPTVPWLIKGLLLAAKSKRGRELLFAAALGAYELSRSDEARKLYARARAVARDPRPRDFVRDAARSAAARVQRRA